MRFVDLSAPIVPSPSEVPELLWTEVEFADHAAGAATIQVACFPLRLVGGSAAAARVVAILEE
jgi:kynurenine formamidase